MNFNPNNPLDEIIENLYLGSYEAACDISLLKEKGIKKVLSVMDCKDGPNYNPEEFIHKKIKVDDFVITNIIQYFGECLHFIRGEEKILVHCMSGASRSATIVIAYLMWIKKWTFKEALDYVKKKRPIVFPNDGFRDQLKLFEKLLVDNNYDIDKINFSEIKWEPSQKLIDDYKELLKYI